MSRAQLVEAVAADCRKNVPVDVQGGPVEGPRAELGPGDLGAVGSKPLPHRHATGGDHLALPLRFQQAANLGGYLGPGAAGHVLAVRFAVPVAQEHRATPTAIGKLVDRAFAIAS